MKTSIVIITYNQQIQTDLVLYSLSLQQKIDFSDVEIIIVDDGSRIPYQTLQSFPSVPNKMNIKIIYQENKGRSSARNTGIWAASNDFLIFIDGDRILDELFIYNYLTQSRDGLNVGCVKEIYCRDLSNFDTLKEKIKHKQFKTPYYVHQTEILYDSKGLTDSGVSWITTFSGNMGIPRKMMEDVGAFNGSFKNWGFEHFELGYRLQKLGVPFFQVKACNYHLAHIRDMKQLQQNIRESIQRFMTIHDDSVLFDFQKFLFGEISLQEFETNKNAAWLVAQKEDIFVGVGKRGVT